MNQKSTPQGLHRLFKNFGKVFFLGVMVWGFSLSPVSNAHAVTKNIGPRCDVDITNSRGYSLDSVSRNQAYYAEVTWFSDDKQFDDIKRVEVFSQGDLMGSSAKSTEDLISIPSGYYDFDDVPVDGAFTVGVSAKITKSNGSTVTCSKMLWVH